MGLCWYCFWGWPRKIREIYEEGVEDSSWSAMHFGPAHIVWEDENFDDPQWCIDNLQKYRGDCTDAELEVIKKSLLELAALPMEIRVPPKGYDPDKHHPNDYPPPKEWKCRR